MRRVWLFPGVLILIGLAILPGAILAQDMVTWLIEPEDGSKGIPLPVILYWGAVTPSSQQTVYYNLRISRNVMWTDLVLDEIMIDTVFIGNETLFTAGTRYYWKVRVGITGDGLIVWSPEWSEARDFTTQAPPPGIPDLLNPPDNSKDLILPVLLEWTEAAGATSYEINIAIDSLFTAIIVAGESPLNNYEISDNDLFPEGLFYWRVRALADTGAGTIAGNWSKTRSFTTDFQSGVGFSEHENLPATVILKPNYPNPFNPSTEIGFYLAQTTNVQLSVYNVMGQKIVHLVEGTLSRGKHLIQWDGCDADGNTVASGVYLYRLTTDGFTRTGRMVLLR